MTYSCNREKRSLPSVRNGRRQRHRRGDDRTAESCGCGPPQTRPRRYRVSHKRAHRLMQAADLRCKHPRPYKVTTVRGSERAGLVDLVNRDLAASAPAGQYWLRVWQPDQRLGSRSTVRHFGWRLHSRWYVAAAAVYFLLFIDFFVDVQFTGLGKPGVVDAIVVPLFLVSWLVGSAYADWLKLQPKPSDPKWNQSCRQPRRYLLHNSDLPVGRRHVCCSPATRRWRQSCVSAGPNLAGIVTTVSRAKSTRWGR